jgi:hypothetical protein
MFFYLKKKQDICVCARALDWDGTERRRNGSASISLPRQICHAIKRLDSDDHVTICVGHKVSVTCIISSAF